MAVYKRNYGRFQGVTTPTWSRFLVFPRYAFQDVFKSRIFVAFFTLCFALPFVGLLMIYLHHNIAALNFLQLPLAELKDALPINGKFFLFGLEAQGFLAFLLTLGVGPALIAPDLRNNGLALYLSRPFSRAEYVLGKMMVLIVLLSLITWVPGLLLFFFQSYLEGFGWLRENIDIAAALFVGSWAWILVLSLVSLALSAWVKWKPVARVAMIVVFYVFIGFAAALNEALDTWWGWMFSIWTAIQNVWGSMFGVKLDGEMTVPLWSAWLTLAVCCLLCLWLLSRRIKAYEVVR